MARSTTVQTILDFHDLPVFDTAIAYPMIFVARNAPARDAEAATLAEPLTLDPPYPDVTAVVREFGHRLAAGALSTDGTWRLASSAVADMLQKMRSAGPRLIEIAGSRVFRGLTTGLNEAFVISPEVRQAILEDNPECDEIIRPFAAGRDVQRWSLRPTTRWIIVTAIGVDMTRYPAVMEHLQRFEELLIPRSDQGNYWWELRPCTYYEEFPEPKLVSTKVSIKPTFALDRAGHYLGNTSYFIPVADDAAFLLGVLNSAPSKFYARNTFVGKQNGWYEVQPGALEAMPIPDAATADRAAIAEFAGRCIEAAGANCDVWERELDERVAALYGLDVDDLVKDVCDAIRPAR